MIEAQLVAGYKSTTDFRDAFSRMMETAPTLLEHSHILKASWLNTRLGPMMAIADDHALYLLEFVDRRGLKHEVERLQQKTKSAMAN